ncbi:hypothetical protein F2P56_024066, partial [Juglans regia]
TYLFTNSNTSTHPLENTIIAINAHNQLLYKLTSSNFLAWHAQFDSLVIGYDLQGFINGSHPCPMLGTNPTADAIAARSRSICQDKLLLNCIFALVLESIMPLIAASGTSREAWLKLTRLYANRSRTRIMQLKDQLNSLNRGSNNITEYLQQVKCTADELALVDSPLTNDDLMLYILNGLGSEFRDIAAPIRTRETPFTFKELHDLLVSHETYLKCLEMLQQTTIATTNYHQKKAPQTSSHRGKAHKNNTSQTNLRSSQSQNISQSSTKPSVIYQLCAITGHTARQCKKLWNPTSPNANGDATSIEKPWVVDSGASHHITFDMSKLSVHFEYNGTNEVIIRDGSGLAISHVGTVNFWLPTRTIALTNTLCVPAIHKNLILIHEFTKTNNLVIEFHPFHFFFVNDLTSRATLMQGKCDNGIYTIPASSCNVGATKEALTTECVSSEFPVPHLLKPTSVHKALKDLYWRQAMREEFTALVRHGTWKLVPAASHQNLVGSKWVFRIKRKPEGSVDRYKVHLVAKGFH